MLSQLNISFLSHADVPEAIQPSTTTLPLHLALPRADILGASAAGFVAPYQIFNFPGSTTSSFSEAAACQPAAILWSGADIVCSRRIKPCMLSEKVLFLVLLFLFCSPTLRNYSYSNRLPSPARGMENNIFFSFPSRRNCTMCRRFCQQANGQCVTALALQTGSLLHDGSTSGNLDTFQCYGRMREQGWGEADRFHSCNPVFFCNFFFTSFVVEVDDLNFQNELVLNARFSGRRYIKLFG